MLEIAKFKTFFVYRDFPSFIISNLTPFAPLVRRYAHSAQQVRESRIDADRIPHRLVFIKEPKRSRRQPTFQL